MRQIERHQGRARFKARDASCPWSRWRTGDGEHCRLQHPILPAIEIIAADCEAQSPW